MAFSAVTVRVMITSPKDVEQERRITVQVIEDWNAINAAQRGIVLMPVRWETHASAQYGRPAQEDINEHLTDAADIVIGIFWSRLGTPTQNYESGSVEEIKRHSASGKPTMLYFSSMPLPSDADLEQVEGVRRFKSESYPKATVWSYSSLEDFRVLVTRHLSMEMGRTTFSISPITSAPRSDRTGLSADALDLLREAGRSREGLIMRMKTQFNPVIQANRRTFTDGESPRSSARWVAALEELQERRFVSAANDKGTAFQVTHQGFAYLDDAGEVEAVESLPSTHLSADAAKLLAACAKHARAWIMEVETTDGWELQAGDSSFPELLGSIREEARWRAALKELLDGGMINQKTGDIYRVSHQGFAEADRFTGETPRF